MPKRRLLVIEDDENIASRVCRVVMEANFYVHASCNSTDTPSLYGQFPPHIIMLNIFMSDVDGSEVFHFLHKRHNASRSVILSGRTACRSVALKIGQGTLSRYRNHCQTLSHCGPAADTQEGWAFFLNTKSEFLDSYA